MKPEYQNNKPWRVLYQAALNENDSCVLVKRLSEAEEAIVERARQLFHEIGADVENEREGLDDALYSLQALRGTLERNTRAA